MALILNSVQVFTGNHPFNKKEKMKKRESSNRPTAVGSTVLCLVGTALAQVCHTPGLVRHGWTGWPGCGGICLLDAFWLRYLPVGGTQPDDYSIACSTGIGQTFLLPATLRLVAVAKRGVINSVHLN